MQATEYQVRTYRLAASNGKHIRMATMIVLADGKQHRFLEKLSRREAIRQFELETYHQHMAIARQMGTEALRAFHATTPRP